MGRTPCCDQNGLKKGPWTPEEDQKLVQCIQKHGHGSWRALPKLAGLNRCGKSCRLRWTNYLRPDIKRGRFSQEEEQTILNLHSVLGNKWSAIAMHLPGRTDNEIKNYWNTHLKKKLIQMGFDPMTHRPRTDLFADLPLVLALAQLRQFIENHQWVGHAVSLQAEAIRAASLGCFQNLLQSGTANVPPSCLIANHTETTSLVSSLITPNVSPLIPSLARDKNIHSYSQINIQPPPLCEPHANSNTPLASHPHSHSALPPLIDISAAANQGDACSISSCLGTELPPFLSELLLDDDPFMAEFT